MVAVADYKIGPKERRRDFHNALYSALDQDRNPYVSSWKELNKNILPSKARFFITNHNKPEIRNSSIINSTPIDAGRVLGDGMNQGITSQASPWFRLSTPDESKNEQNNVQVWLHEVTQRMIAVFAKSNFYDVMPGMYKEGGVYGTAVIGVDEDDEDVLFFQQFPIGSYWIGDDSKGRVRVFIRRFRMTIRQVIEKFGKTKNGKLDDSNLSIQVTQAYDAGRLQDWIDVTHIIYPNDQYNPEALDSKFKKFASIYFESGNGSKGEKYLSKPDEDKYLSEKGYDYFPILCFRWEVNGEDSYASGCPGMHTIGDCKGLQKMESLKLQAIEKKVKPPMNAPTSMRNQNLSILPAALNFSAQQPGTKGFTPTFEVNFDITELRDEITATEGRINEGFYKTIFLALSTDDRLQRATAEEIREIKLEKFTVLGSVLERVNVGVLNPLIDIVFQIMWQRGLIPQPPQELEGTSLRVEYLSVLAQAQRQAGSNNLRRFMADIGGLSQIMPQALHKINVDQLVDDLAKSSGVSPKIINDEDKVKQIRDEEAKALQTQRMLDAMSAVKQGASAAKDLSEANLSGDSVLSGMANR